MKSTILLPVIAICTLVQLEPGFGAIMAEWHTFITSTATFPVSATSSDTSIASAVMNDPVNLIKTPNETQPWFSLTGWNPTSTVDTGEYFEISLNIGSGYK